MQLARARQKEETDKFVPAFSRLRSAACLIAESPRRPLAPVAAATASFVCANCESGLAAMWRTSPPEEVSLSFSLVRLSFVVVVSMSKGDAEGALSGASPAQKAAL